MQRSLITVVNSRELCFECLSVEHGSQGVIEQLEMHSLFLLWSTNSIETILTAPQSYD